jgi:hypothetical protein
LSLISRRELELIHLLYSTVRRIVAEVLRAELPRLCRLQRRIPATVGYTITNALVVTDALGESLTIPWSLVSSYDVSPTFYLVYLVLTSMLPPSPYLPESQDLHKSLIKHFRGKVGEQRVLDEKYCIARASDGTVIKAANWSDIVHAGEEVMMSMLVETPWVHGISKTCPKCGRTRLGTYRDQGWIIWCVPNFAGILKPKAFRLY